MELHKVYTRNVTIIDDVTEQLIAINKWNYLGETKNKSTSAITVGRICSNR